MTQLSPRLTLTLILTFITSIIHSQPISAQITPDNSLGAESSTVRQDNIKNLPSDVIEGGASRGSNLFHSFQEFNVNEGRGAYFANPAVIQNIFSRVTGGNISQILGTLGVLGNANLYLINPNGIIFGPNARLDVRGAFVGSTADSLLFNNNYEFSASNPTAPPLLTVDIPLGVRFRENTGDINSTANLATPSDLTLQGANVNLTGSVVAGGNLRLEALDTLTIRDSLENPFLAVSGQDLLIQGNNIDIFALNNAQSAIASYGNLTLKSANPVLGDAHYYSGGSFSIENLDGSLGELLSLDDPVIFSLGDVSFDAYIGSSLHIFSAGSVNIPNFVRIIATDPVNGIVETITLSDGTTVNVDGQNEPTLDIRAGVDPSVIGGTFFNPFNFFPFDPNIISPPSFTSSASSADINIGTIIFADFFDNPLSGKILLTNQYQPNSTLNGNISISATLGEIATQTENPNSGGSVIVDSKGRITINGIVEASASQGTGGNITFIAQDNISFNSEASIFANGVLSGSINLKTNEDIFVTGGEITSNVLSSVNNTVSSETGGNIEISAKSLFLLDGARLTTSTFGLGNTGTINITATDAISLSGMNDQGFPSRISNIVGSLAEGNAGGIIINTGSLLLNDGTLLVSATAGQGNAGAINITATDTISLSGMNSQGLDSFIQSTVLPNAEGNSEGITINTSLLSLNDGARLISSTSGKGNAGAISITATNTINLSGVNGEGDSSRIVSLVNAEAQGNSEGITINTSSLSLNDGAKVGVSTVGQGNAGAVNITANDTISLSGMDNRGFASDISNRVESEATGNSGGIIINTGSLLLNDGAELNASTFGQGNAGAVNITAKDTISLSGVDIEGDGSLIASGAVSQIEGNSGGIIINTGSLSLNDGASLNTSTLGKGNAGIINITATDTISLSGVDNEGDASRISSQVNSGAEGNSEGMIINTRSLFLNNGAILNSTTLGKGNAGAINITATDTISLSGLRNEGFGSIIDSSVGPDAQGNSGGLTIKTGSLFLNDGANVSASTVGQGDAGAINITATDTISLSGLDNEGSGSFIGSQVDIVEAIGNSGVITINTNSLSLNNGAMLSATTFGKGDAGAINITAADTISLSGVNAQGDPSFIASEVGFEAQGDSQGIIIDAGSFFLNDGAFISSSTSGQGNAGGVDITATNTVSLSGVGLNEQESRSQISSQVNSGAQGNSGGIAINTKLLSLNDGASVNASTRGEGNAGIINITSTDAISLSGIDSQGLGSNIQSQVFPFASGNSEGIILNTDSLSLKDGAFVSASTFGQGDAGRIEITADTILLSGSDSQAGLTIASFVSPEAEGNSGGIIIDTGRLFINDGAGLNSSTLGKGNAGDINITATDTIALFGVNNSRIFSQVNNPEAIGNSGDIIIDTGRLFLNQGSILSSSTLGQGNAGKIEITATDAILMYGTDNQGKGSAIFSITTGRGSANTITINAPKLILTDAASISAETTNTGNSGNIIINAPDFVTLGANTKLTVETSSAGTAGDIDINTPLLTIGENAQLSATATETSTAPTAGNINLNVNQLNISGELGIFAETNSTPTAGSLTIQPYQIDGQDAYPTNPNLNIQFTENGFISARTTSIGEGGSITITAPENIDIRGLGSITAETSGSGNAGSILIDSNEINLSEGITVSASTSNIGDSQDITLTGNIINLDNATIQALTTGEGNPGSILISNGVNQANQVNITNNSTISTEINGEGDRSTAQPANITINSENLSLTSSQITASTTSNRDAGNINLTGNNFNLDNGTIQALTTGEGNPGSISISNGGNKANQVNITNNSTISTEIRGEGDRSTAQPANITINSRNLSLQSSQITASTTSNRDAGNINLNNNNISLDNGIITAITSGSGKGGNITIPNTQTLNLINNSGIIALTQGEGIAGNLNFNVSQSVTIDSGSFFNVETQAEGKAGNIDISTPILTIGDNAELSARSRDNATGEAGNITLNTNKLNISGELGIFAETESIADAGNLIINPLADNPNLIINFFNEGNISASTFGDGNGGDIDITAPEIINISGNGSIQVEANSSGNAGEIFINANNQINLSDGINISALTNGSGNAGNILINANNQLNLNNGVNISASTNGSGIAGNINLTTENLNLSQGITITASTTGDGDAGNINLSANNFNFNQAEINAFTNSTGNAGNIIINYQEENANNLTLTDSTISTEIQDNGNANQLSNITIKTDNLNSKNSEITASTRGNGNAGNITIIDTENINLNNSKIIATTSGEGDTGEINLSAQNNFNLINDSEISSSVEENGIGNSLTINISTPQLTLDYGSQINAFTDGVGNAGSININNQGNNSNQVSLNNNSRISTEIRSEGEANERSNININANQINLNQNSEITASNNQGRGDAGNITLSTPQLELNNDSKINSFTNGIGSGGSIEISDNGNKSQFVSLENNSEISTEIQANGEANQRSNINLNANQINLNQNSEITASNNQGRGDAGNITLSTPQLELNNGSKINSFTNGIGSGGSIDISDNGNKTQSVTLTNNSVISTEISDNGEADEISNITLKTNNLNSENSTITASTSGKGNAGNITILDTKNINLNNSNIIATTSGDGDTGEINLSANNNANLNNSQINSSVETEGIGNSLTINISTPQLSLNDSQINAFTLGEGNAGNLNIFTQQLNLNNQSEINAFSDGVGNGGNINIPNADTINLDNSNISSAIAPNGIATQPSNIEINARQVLLNNNSQISASTAGDGNAGEITVTADNLTLTNQSVMETNTASNGEAGDIILNIQDNLNINDSAIAASTQTNSTGRGGDIIINSPSIINLDNNASITVNSQGEGDGGNISLATVNLTLNDNSTISATTASGEGGNLNFTITENLIQENNSPISAEAGGTGNGGNINISAEYLIGSDNSTIDANAFEGNGGNINITAKGIFRDLGSPITASSELGVDGIVETNTPEVDPSRGLVNLPTNIVDANDLIAQNACRQGNQSEFTVTGKGGLPSSPQQINNSSEIEVGLVEGTSETSTSELKSNQPVANNDNDRKIIPAQGWQRNEKGELVLVAYTTEKAVNRKDNSQVTCPSN